MKIGVFDSGVGGEKIAGLIRQEHPDYEVISVSDAENLPYGTKTKDQLAKLVLPKLLQMQHEGCDILVIACNTVTTLLISDIRKELRIPVVGFEPMVKPAAQQTKTGVIAVCATPATLQSERYAYLKQEFATGTKVIEPDCSDWASLIENNSITKRHIQDVANSVLSQRADVVVLGCTHYHWIEEEINAVVKGRAQVMQPEQAVLRRLDDIIATLDK